MIDIVRTLRDQHPDLGPYVVALRAGSPVLDPSVRDRFTPEVGAWLEQYARNARLVTREVILEGSDAPRVLQIVVFDTAQDLAQFTSTWT